MNMTPSSPIIFLKYFHPGHSNFILPNFLIFSKSWNLDNSIICLGYLYILEFVPPTIQGPSCIQNSRVNSVCLSCPWFLRTSLSGTYIRVNQIQAIESIHCAMLAFICFERRLCSAEFYEPRDLGLPKY